MLWVHSKLSLAGGDTRQGSLPRAVSPPPTIKMMCANLKCTQCFGRRSLFLPKHFLLGAKVKNLLKLYITLACYYNIFDIYGISVKH
jgi:hypothetical protein